MADDRANFCSVDGSRLRESSDPLAKLDRMTIRQVADCLKGMAEQDFGDEARIEVAIENLGKKIDAAICGEKLSTVGVIALGMLANMMERLEFCVLDRKPSHPKPTPRIQ
jgi:hypothetical protein